MATKTLKKANLTEAVLDTEEMVEEVTVEVAEDSVSEDTTDSVVKTFDVEKMLEEQKKMFDLIEQQNKMIEMLKAQVTTPQANIISLEGVDKVTIVHLKDYPTAIRLSNNKLIRLLKIKQTQEITRSEALELINSHPKAFEKGWITFSGEIGQQILETNGVKIDKKVIDDIFNYKDSISLDKDALVKYYNELMEAQKDMFIAWWYNEAAANNPRFLDIEVVNSLNKASGGRFSKLIKDKITASM